MASPSPAVVPQQVDRSQGVLDLDARPDVAGTALAAPLASSRRGLVAQNRLRKAAPLPPAMSKQDESGLAYPLAEHPRAEFRWERGFADVGLRQGLSERQGQFRALQRPARPQLPLQFAVLALPEVQLDVREGHPLPA
jgi:hypothetical protein